MEKTYDYLENMARDIVVYLEAHKDVLEKYDTITGCVNSLCINDDFVEAITGLSRMYAKTEEEAEEYLKGNMDLFIEATKEYGFNWEAIEGLDSIDVAIRLELLGKATEKAIINYFIDFFADYFN